MSEVCRACGASTSHFARADVLGDVEAEYVRCQACGLVMAVRPHWLDTAYSEAIAGLDIGLLDRCLLLSNVTASVLKSERLKRGTFLDWAGGYGTLTRLMRDRGFDFRHVDAMASNIFAAGPGMGDDVERYDLITAFEVLEHLENPVEALRPLAQRTDRLLMTTQLLPDPAPAPTQWWYYALESGQHITFFTREAIAELAASLGFDRVHSGGFLHLFHRGNVSARTRQLVSHPAVAYGAGLITQPLDRRRSLMQLDIDAYLNRMGRS